MKASHKFFAIAGLAILAAAGSAFAGEADPSGQFALQIDGQRTRAEVKAEALNVWKNKSSEPAGSRVLALPTSDLKASAVRAEAIQAVRLGQVVRGEAGTI